MGRELNRLAMMSSCFVSDFCSYPSASIVLAATPEKNAIENEAPVSEERWPNLIRGLAKTDIFRVQFSASIKFATSNPMEIKKSKRASGHNNPAQIFVTISSTMFYCCYVKLRYDIKGFIFLTSI
jgi:hypothetical protein